MSKRNLTVALLIVCILQYPSLLYAQNGQSLSSFRVLLTDGSRFEGKQGMLTHDSLTGKTHLGNKVSFSTDSIRFLERCTGSRAAMGALSGALSGAVLGMSLYDVVNEGDQQIKAELLLACAASGTLLGVLIGSSFRTWEGVPIRPTLNLNVLERQGFLAFKVTF